jgi:hypothetical protein
MQRKLLNRFIIPCSVFLTDTDKYQIFHIFVEYGARIMWRKIL